MQKAIHAGSLLLSLIRAKWCAVNCEQAIDGTLLRIHLFFRKGVRPLSLFDHIHPLPPLYTVRQFICNHLMDQCGSGEWGTFISGGSGETNCQYEYDCDSA